MMAGALFAAQLRRSANDQPPPAMGKQRSLDRSGLGRADYGAGMRFPFTHYIERGDEEIELSVIYSVTPFIPATYYQPAEGGEVEIVSVKCDGAEFGLYSFEEDALQRVCEERAATDWAEAKADEADWRYQEYRDRRLMERWEREA